jgi:two-component system sensor histidine kinase BaeS
VIGRGISLRIALAALAAAAVAVAIMAFGVLVVGARTFMDMMVDSGDSAEHARAMYDQAVTSVVLIAVGVAVVASVVLALVVGRRLGRPLATIASAARRVASGDYSARVPREGPDELAGLADSFNQMAADLEAQERIRRDFIVNAAHELLTPLTNLKGYLEALRDGVIPADRATYESLLDEAERLVRLSRSLDALGEGDAATRTAPVTELDLAEAVRAAVDLARAAAERAHLELRVEQPAHVPVRAAADDLAQVLSNLLSNAVRYSPAGGTVVVRVEPRAADVLVTVANPSEPIPADDLERVFERFYRVEKSRDRARGGAGIGLAIVKQLVEAAGGRVGAESADGQTRIWFTVPA